MNSRVRAKMYKTWLFTSLTESSKNEAEIYIEGSLGQEVGGSSLGDSKVTGVSKASKL